MDPIPIELFPKMEHPPSPPPTAFEENFPENVDSWIQEIAEEHIMALRPGPAEHEGYRPPHTPPPPRGARSSRPSKCCALERLAWEMPDLSAFTGLLVHQRRLQFLCWVAYYRSTDLHILKEERFRCPMLWCRTHIQGDIADVVNHVTACEHLDDMVYHCPYCQTAERFGVAGEPGARKSRRQVFKETFDAIRRLGSKNTDVPRSRPGAAPSRRERRATKSASELAGPILQGSRELDSYEVRQGSRSRASSVRSSAMELAVDSDDAKSVRRKSSWSSSARSTSRGPSASGSPVSPVSPSEQWTAYPQFDTPISSIDLAAFGSWPTTDFDNLFAFDIPMASPVTPTTRPRALSGAFPQTESSPAPSTSRSLKRRSATLPQIRINTSFQDTTEASAQYSLPEVTVESPRKKRQKLAFDEERSGEIKHVEEFREIFHALVKESARKVCQPPLSKAARLFVKSNPSPAAVFESGLGALRKVIQSTLPTTFWEVFGFIHVSCAAAMATGEQDLPSRMGDIFSDIISWSSAIEVNEDRLGFVQLAHEIWGPSDVDDSLLQTPRAPTAPNLMDDDTSSQHSRSSADSATWLESLAIEPQAQRRQLLSGLRRSICLRFCFQFLSALETEAVLRQSRVFEPTLPSSNTQAAKATARHNKVLKDVIVDPLITIQGLEGFRKAIIETGRLLNNRHQLSLRETELNLLHNGRRYTQSHKLFRQFADTVQSLCDRASTIVGWGLAQREDFYIEDVDQILAIYHDLRAQKKESARRPPEPSALEADIPMTGAGTENIYEAFDDSMLSEGIVAAGLTRPFSFVPSPPSEGEAAPQSQVFPDFSFPDQVLPDLPELDGSAILFPEPVAETAFASYPPVEAPAAYLSSTQPGQSRQSPCSSSSSLHAATTLGQPQAGPASSGSSGANNPDPNAMGTMTCNHCGKVLSGKTVWLPSNMQRHIREKHSGAKPRLTCHVPGCGKTFGRNHNLTHHMRTVHGA